MRVVIGLLLLLATLSPSHAMSCYPDPCDQSDLPLAPDQQMLFADLSDNSGDAGLATHNMAQEVRAPRQLPERPLPTTGAAGDQEFDLGGRASTEEN